MNNHPDDMAEEIRELLESRGYALCDLSFISIKGRYEYSALVEVEVDGALKSALPSDTGR